MDSSTRPTFSWPDYVVLGVVLSVSSVIGIFYAIRGRRKRTTDEFIVASRQMGFVPVAMSLLASFFTGIYIQAMVSEVYFRGAMAPFGAAPSLLVTAYMAGSIFLPTFYKLRVKSVYQYLEMRFNNTVRNCCLIVGYLHMILHAGIATFAACLVLTTVSDMSFFTSVVVLSGVCTFYTAVGGMKAVVWADAFQMFLIFSPLIGAVTMACTTLELGEIWNIAAKGGRLEFSNFSFDPTEYLTMWTIIVGGVFVWMPSICVLQYQVRRYNTCQDARTANIAMSLFTFGCLLIVVLCGLAGLCVYAVYVDCDPFTTGRIRFRDELLPYFVLDAFSRLPGLPGLMVSGLCSAALSTVSSVINSIVTLTGEHFITRIWKEIPDSTYLLITKLLAVFFGVLNIGMTYFMSSLGSLLPTLIGVVGIAGGPVMGVFLLGFMFPKCNSKGALVGFVTGFLFGLWILIGSIIYPTPPIDLPLSAEGCSVELVTNKTTYSSNVTAHVLYSNVMVTELPGISDEGNGVEGLVNSTQIVSTLGFYSSQVTHAINSTAGPKDENVLALYLISRWWYPTFTTCTVVVIGLFTSLVTGFNDPSLMNQVLFVDWYSVFCWCRKRKPLENDLVERNNRDSLPSDADKAEVVSNQTNDNSSEIVTTL